jgi:hypothetical protein
MKEQYTAGGITSDWWSSPDFVSSERWKVKSQIEYFISKVAGKHCHFKSEIIPGCSATL